MPPCTILRTVCRKKKKLFFALKMTSIYVLLFICILPLLRYHLHFSKMYKNQGDVHFEKAIDVNHERRIRANAFLKTINASDVKQKYLINSSTLRFVIGVITTARKTSKLDYRSQTEYLTQTMSRLHDILNRSLALDDIFLFICNVDPSPNNHKEATRMASYFPTKTRHFSSKREADTFRQQSRHTREKEDYAFCLQSALEHNSKYILLLQDDAYPQENFYDILNYVLQHKLETRIRRGELERDQGDWAWLKLNTPYYRNDFHGEPFTIYQWIALTIFFAGVLALIVYMYLELGHISQSRLTSTSTSNSKWPTTHLTAYAVFLVSFPFMFAVIWITGRPYFLKAHAISHNFYTLEPGTSCCLAAVVYPSERVPDIVNFVINEATKKPKIPLDWALDDYRQDNGLKQYLLIPNLFTHIGLYSTLNLKFYKKRAFAYEYFND
ncbi:post-GPI attachment to proteins factor 4-like [Amphiura filiformis]|uniref:post-GPI attachment to proteins factor 4-like n=1 Tax=Amphiura filiformis TaxID=82378 RepID=UPI003B21ACC2